MRGMYGLSGKWLGEMPQCTKWTETRSGPEAGTTKGWTDVLDRRQIS
jgi:hypothetical protein